MSKENKGLECPYVRESSEFQLSFKPKLKIFGAFLTDFGALVWKRNHRRQGPNDMKKYVTQVIPFHENNRGEWQAVRDFYRLRKTVFMDGMGWDLQDIAGREVDQYDCAWAVYILVKDVESGEVVGGARMLRTDREEYLSQLDEEPTSYMLRDAYLGRIDELPQDLCFLEPPSDPNIWELTRLAATGRAGEQLMLAVNDFLAEQGARQCLAMGSQLVFRVAKKLGFRPEPIGDVQSNESGSFFAFRCWVYHAEERARRVCR